MKFEKPEKYNTWSPEKTKERIEFVRGEIAAFNQELNKLDSHMNELRNQKRIISFKVSKKERYINQLKNQLLEFESDEEWK